MANKRHTTKTEVRTHAVRRVKAASTYDVDIGQEFKDIKSAIQHLRDDLNEWKTIFNSQLTRLNDNMASALKTISNHEIRLTELENKALKSETEKKTISEMAKFGWWAAKALIGATILVTSILGTAEAWKIFFGN